jgi:hypothetical protein
VFEIRPVRFDVFKFERPEASPKKVVPQIIAPLIGPATLRDE